MVFFPFNGVLFTQEIPNELILLGMGYGVILRLEKKKSWKNWVISLWNFEVLVFTVQAFKEIL